MVRYPVLCGPLAQIGIVHGFLLGVPWLLHALSDNLAHSPCRQGIRKFVPTVPGMAAYPTELNLPIPHQPPRFLDQIQIRLGAVLP